MPPTAFSDLPPAIQWHLLAAVAALLTGPLALYSRKGSPLHRSAGYVWVLCMLMAALSSVFIRDHRLPNLWGYTPIHLLTVLTLAGISSGVWLATQRRTAEHRRVMRHTYIGGCLVAGLFTLLPGRFLGNLLWHHATGLI